MYLLGKIGKALINDFLIQQKNEFSGGRIEIEQIVIYFKAERFHNLVEMGAK